MPKIQPSLQGMVKIVRITDTAAPEYWCHRQKTGKAQRPSLLLSALNHLIITPQSSAAKSKKLPQDILRNIWLHFSFSVFPAGGMFARKHTCAGVVSKWSIGSLGWEGASGGHLMQPPPAWAGEITGGSKQMLTLPLNSVIRSPPTVKLLDLPKSWETESYLSK